MKYRISSSKEIDIKQIVALRMSIGWSKRRRTDKKWREILSKSSYVCGIWDDKKLIGMGRILEDGIMCMFYDIAVHKDYQGKGIGKIIVNKLLDKVKNKGYTSIGLFTGEHNISFYKKFGFEVAKVGMECKKYMK